MTLPRRQSPLWRALLALAPLAACAPRAGASRPEARPAERPLAGRYWGRWSDTPPDTRVTVWIDGDTRRFRGAWDLPPWHGEFDGARDGDALDVRWQQEGVVAVHVHHSRAMRWRLGPDGSLRGEDGDAGVIELTPARDGDPRLREGLWMSRWTGLPPGLGVETVVHRGGDGRWHAAYRYQGREGSFVGELRGERLAIRWREVSSQDAVSEGRGLLARSRTGYEGTYGVGDSVTGAGRWSIESFEIAQNR
ncbi:MAG: hypothetical protein R3A48_04990 [Polyangiales bacterium]